ncbi:hypothetical protein ACHBHL_11010 [Streptococcus sp. A27]|uniref:hypothetical protein n=1 Tax=unclassified Streptococcus TaxID=2608887 RepID=UPI00374D6C53
MKKTFVTLATVAALVAAAAPAATTLANNPTYNVESQKADAIVAELGREYALAYANAASAKIASETTAHILSQAQEDRDTVYTAEDAKVAAAQAALDAVNTEWENAKIKAANDYPADATKYNAAVTAADFEYGIKQQEAKDTLADVTTKAKEAKAKADKAVAEAQADFNKAQAELAAAVAAKEAAYNKAINGGLTQEQVKQAEAGAEVTAPSNTAAKPAAKTVAAAKTGTGSKTLPKTSAAK